MLFLEGFKYFQMKIHQMRLSLLVMVIVLTLLISCTSSVKLNEDSLDFSSISSHELKLYSFHKADGSDGTWTYNGAPRLHFTIRVYQNAGEEGRVSFERGRGELEKKTAIECGSTGHFEDELNTGVEISDKILCSQVTITDSEAKWILDRNETFEKTYAPEYADNKYHFNDQSGWDSIETISNTHLIGTRKSRNLVYYYFDGDTLITIAGGGKVDSFSFEVVEQIILEVKSSVLGS